MQTVLSTFRVLPTIPQTFPHFWIPHFYFPHSAIPHFTNNLNSPHCQFAPVTNSPHLQTNVPQVNISAFNR